MNWGGFAQGFSTGFNNGVQMGKTVKQAIQEKRLEDARAQGMISAKAAQEKAIADSVKETGIDTATQPTQATSDAQPAPSAQAASAPAAAAPDQPPPVDASLPGAPAAAPDETGATTPAAAPTQPVAEAAPEVVRTQSAAAAPPLPAPKEIATPKEPVPAQDGSPAASGMATPQKPTRFTVNGKGFGTREEALAYAKANAPDIMDFMHKTLVPKMQEAYLEQGDIEKAEAWGKWAKDRQNQKNMETWAKAYKSAQAGDMEGAANHVFELYKGYDDGVTPLSKETVKDKDGNVTGFNVRLKDDATGEERTQFVDKRALTEMGLAALSPPQMFEQVYKRQQQADLLSAKAAIDAQNDQRTFNKDVTLKNMEIKANKERDASKAKADADKQERQHGYKLGELVKKDDLEKAGYGAKKKAELQAEIDLAKENGATPEEIKAMVRHKVIGTEYKKTTDPSERKALVRSDLMKNDPTFPRAKPEEQEAKIATAMKQIYGDDVSAKPAQPKAAQPDPTLAVGAPAPAGLKDGAYKDQKTGQPFRVQGGKIVPLDAQTGGASANF